MGRRPRGGPPTPDRPTHARSRTKEAEDACVRVGRVRVGRRGVSYWGPCSIGTATDLRAGRRAGQPGRLRAGARPGADAPRRTRPHTGHRGRTRDFRHQPYTVRCVHSVSPVFRAVPASCVCARCLSLCSIAVCRLSALRSAHSAPLRCAQHTVPYVLYTLGSSRASANSSHTVHIARRHRRVAARRLSRILLVRYATPPRTPRRRRPSEGRGQEPRRDGPPALLVSAWACAQS